MYFPPLVALKAILPLLAWFRGLALESTSGPLLELGRCLLVGGSCNGCVCHLLCPERKKMNSQLVLMSKPLPPPPPPLSPTALCWHDIRPSMLGQIID